MGGTADGRRARRLIARCRRGRRGLAAPGKPERRHDRGGAQDYGTGARHRTGLPGRAQQRQRGLLGDLPAGRAGACDERHRLRVAHTVVGRRGDVGGGGAAFLVDVGDDEAQREQALGGGVVVLAVGGDAFDPADATLDVARLGPENDPPAARPLRVCMSGACRSGAGACGSGTAHTTGWIAGVAGDALDAMDVTPPAAAATTAAAAAPVTRVFRITAVLSMGPTHQRG